MPDNVRATILIVIGLIAVYLSFRNKHGKSFLLLFAFVGPYAHFNANFGFVLDPAKLIAIVALVSGFLFKGFKTYSSGSYSQYFIPYFIYIAVLTVAMASFWPDFDENKMGFFYGNSGRWVTQLFLQAIGIAVMWYLVRYIKTWDDVDKVLSITLLSMLIMGIIGLYTYFAQRVGLPYLRIARAEGLMTGPAVTTDIFGLRFLRAYSLSGEPKGLASDMVLGITLLLFVPLKNKSFLVRWLGNVPILVLMLVTLFLTYSTAGYIMFPAALFLVFLILAKTRMEPSKVAYAILFGITLILIVMLFNLGTYLSDVFLSRLINRIGEDGIQTYAEDGIVSVWLENPSSFFLGVGLGGSNFYIREIDPFTFFGKIAAPRGIYGFVGDKGLVGLVLYLFGSFMCLRVIWREIKAKTVSFQIARGVFIFFVVGLLLIFTKSGWYFQWLVLGLMIASANICSGTRNRMRS